MSILVVAEHDNAALKSATLHTIAAAEKLGKDIHVFVAGHGAQAVATAAASIPGVTKVFRADAQYLARPTAENVAAAALKIIASDNYSHVLAPATSFGKSVAPRIAAKLDVAQISDITAIDSDLRWQRVCNRAVLGRRQSDYCAHDGFRRDCDIGWERNR